MHMLNMVRAFWSVLMCDIMSTNIANIFTKSTKLYSKSVIV